MGSYSPQVAQTIVQMFALLGLNMMALPSLGAIVLIRCRAMIPLMYLTMLFWNLAGRVVHVLYPDASEVGAPPIGFYVNLGLTAVLLIGFALSLAKSSARDGAI
jgi:hypothetical protein